MAGSELAEQLRAAARWQEVAAQGQRADPELLEAVAWGVRNQRAAADALEAQAAEIAELEARLSFSGG